MVSDNLLETDRKRYADDITVQELVRLRVENERLREILRKIKCDIDQAQWPEELCLHWVDDVNAALQPNEAQILATNTYEAEGRN